MTLLVSCAATGTRNITILETTDVHGVILPYDYVEKEKSDASLASAYTYIKEIRKENHATLLLDDGDNLQGQPEVYYYNFIDTVSPHFVSEAMNFIGYDAATAGNHDIETGHSVYDRIVKNYNFPLLAANAVSTETGKPYFKPYRVFIKNGIKIAVLGLITPAVPTWLPEELYSGIEFKDMVETAKLWMPLILKENPDLVIGLFHSGWNKSEEDLSKSNQINENGSAAVAYNVPGFDIILNGHDHKIANEKIVNCQGDTVLILDGGSKSQKIARADVAFGKGKTKGKRSKIVKGEIINVSDFKPDPEFITRFASQNEEINKYVDRIIGNSTATISSRDSYFGPSAFIDMIHAIQLEITNADISFTAPLSFDVNIPKGPVTVGDMFKLYRFENMLYTMTLTGEEVQKYLEYSYAGWFDTMKGPDDNMLLFRTVKDGKPVAKDGKVWLKNQPYNFDSAAGIDYTVDLSKPKGERVFIKGFSDGRAFNKNSSYRIAVNSYRGNGGGGHFTEGAGIKKEELRSRIIASTDKDLRYYILKSIEAKKTINPKVINNWKIIPESWVKEASSREYKLLFGANKRP